jgi:hypothetical protein
MEIYENELVGFFFAPMGADKVELARQLGFEQTNTLRQALAEALLDEEAVSPSLVDSTVAEIEQPPSFKSILLKRGRSIDNRKIVVFRFKDAFKETALPLLGILIAVFSGTLALASVPAALGVVKTLWEKLVVLRSPEDTNAIRLLEALGCSGAANLAANRPAAPTWEQILAASDLAAKDAANALKLLRGKAIIEIDSWGGQAEDVEHLSNRWKVRL